MPLLRRRKIYRRSALTSCSLSWRSASNEAIVLHCSYSMYRATVHHVREYIDTVGRRERHARGEEVLWYNLRPLAGASEIRPPRLLLGGSPAAEAEAAGVKAVARRPQASPQQQLHVRYWRHCAAPCAGSGSSGLRKGKIAEIEQCFQVSFFIAETAAS